MKLAWPEIQNRLQNESFELVSGAGVGTSWGASWTTSWAPSELRKQNIRTGENTRKRPMVRDRCARCQRKMATETKCSQHCNRIVIFRAAGDVNMVDS